MRALQQAADAAASACLADIVALCRVESYSLDLPALEACRDHVEALATRLCGVPDAREVVPGGERGDCLVLTYRGTRPGKAVVIGHYDTVWPAGTLAEWDAVDSPERLSLPGVFDMKFGLVQGLYAFSILRAAGLGHPEVTFVFNGDEELGSLSSRPTIERVCADADATLVLEPSGPGGTVKSGRKGIGIVGVEVRGVEAHAGLEPEKGASAIHALADAVAALTAIADPAAGTTINVGTISGGTGTNVVAGVARASVDIRVLTADEQQRVDAALRQIRPADDRVELRLDVDWNRPPMHPGETGRALLEATLGVAAELGRPLDHVTVGGASDANFVAGIGRPVVCGLGAEGAGPHARHEHVDPRATAFRIAFVAGILSRV